MANIYHRDLTGADLHEPKGVSTASDGEVYVANGAGSGAWGSPVVFDDGLIELPAGVIVPFCGINAPAGWFLCHGQEVNRFTYADLFTALGTLYGAGNGATTFNLPDCRGRSMAGKDNMNGSDAARLTSAGSGVDGDTLGSTGGADDVTLTANQMPVLSGTLASTGAHTHSLNNGNNLIASGGTPVRAIGGSNRNFTTMSITAGGSHSHDVTTPGSGGSHSNMQPTLMTEAIIYHGVL